MWVVYSPETLKVYKYTKKRVRALACFISLRDCDWPIRPDRFRLEEIPDDMGILKWKLLKKIKQ